MSSVSPTTRNRILVLDVLRGVAVLGILLANIAAFSSPFLQSIPTPKPGDFPYFSLETALVAGKFRGMLALLFGAGMYLQFAKRRGVDGNWPKGYIKRSALLAALGFVHMVFIWSGDILFLYALTSLAAMWAVGLAIDKKRIIIGAGVGIAFMLGLLLAGAMYLLSTMPNSPLFSSSGGIGPNEAKIFTSGSYGQQLAFRAMAAITLMLSTPIMLPTLGAQFLLGSWLCEKGIIAKPSAHAAAVKKLLWVGFGVGLPLNFGVGASVFFTHNTSLTFFTEFFAGGVLAVGYLMLGAIAVERGWFKAIQKGLANVGRFALTCYLMQSVICTTVFYSWGFRWYGKLSAVQLLVVVAGTWAIVLLFANLWRIWFDMGPVECLWRSATERKWLRMRREVALEPDSPPPVVEPILEPSSAVGAELGNR
jgi:uncharacterized protein